MTRARFAFATGAALAALLLFAPARADDANDPCGGPTRMLATLNRPTVGFSTCAAPPGGIILEEGYQNQSPTSDLPRLVQYPQGFERIGIGPRFELDLIGPNVNRQVTAGPSGMTTMRGTSDYGVGAKWELRPAAKSVTAFDVLLTAATGTGGFSAGAPTATFNYDFAYQLSPAMSLGTTQAFGSQSGYTSGGDRRRYFLYQPSFVATVQLPHATQLYAEYVHLSKTAPDAGGRSYVDYGVQKLIGERMELDVERSTSKYFGFGIGIWLGR